MDSNINTDNDKDNNMLINKLICLHRNVKNIKNKRTTKRRLVSKGYN